jgi:hypothetical protein
VKPYRSLVTVFGLDLNPQTGAGAGMGIGIGPAFGGDGHWNYNRLDTFRKHIPGEEVLGDWTPRGLSFIEDYWRIKKVQRSLADVQVMKVLLDLHGEKGDGDIDTAGRERIEGKELELTDDQREEMAMRCLRLWRKAMNERIQVSRQAHWSSLFSPLALCIPVLVSVGGKESADVPWFILTRSFRG